MLSTKVDKNIEVRVAYTRKSRMVFCDPCGHDCDDYFHYQICDLECEKWVDNGMHYLESNRLVLEVVSRNGEDASLEITIWTLESQRNEI